MTNNKYCKVEPTLLSVLAGMPIKLVDKTALFPIENDLNDKSSKFLGALLLEEPDIPFNLIDIMEVTEIRQLSRQLWDMANHLVEICIDEDIAKQEKKAKKRFGK
jgi:hypothetical protein